MRSPNLYKFSKLSRLPSTNMDVRLDSTIDSSPTFNSQIYKNSGNDGTFEYYSETTYIFLALTSINSNRVYFELSAILDCPDTEKFAGYVAIIPGVVSNYYVGNSIDSSYANTTLGEYEFGHQSGAGQPVYPTFGIYTTNPVDIPVSHKKMIQLSSSSGAPGTREYTTTFYIQRGGAIFIILYFSAVDATEIAGRWPSQTGTLSITLINKTPGPNYGATAASGSLTLNTS